MPGMSKVSAIKSIKSLLGGSYVNLEIKDEDIDNFFTVAEEKISAVAYDDFYITLPVSSSIDLSSFHVEEVISVTDNNSPTNTRDIDIFRAINRHGSLSSSTAMGSLVDAALMQTLYTELDDAVEKGFHYDSNILYLDSDYVGPVTIYAARRIEYDTATDVKWKSWIFDYVKALCKESVGRVRSKIKTSNLPIELDGDTLLSEGLSEQQSLEESLASYNEGPIFITR